MKKFILIAVSLVLVMALFSCAGSPQSQTAEPEQPERETMEEPPNTQLRETVVVDHKNATFGGDVPFWVTEEPGALEEDPMFEDYYVFMFEETGQSLNGVKTWANNFQAMSEISRLIETRVQEKFAGAEVGDRDMVEGYFERVVKSLSDAEVSGYRKHGDYWVLVNVLDEDGNVIESEYRYRVLYKMPRERLDQLVQAAIDETEPETEEEVTAKERVKEIMEGGL
ncbi:MAG: hypothetical protein K9L68_09580 [Spirochaetales bacterium]|nr:hypothetical protein [Spirochaetales bacterium]MCF7938835.1 hypothetical protein [Spirochaetales bacterium]